MAGFYQNNIAVFPPCGSVIGFFGTFDPSGWVIADGNSRTNTNNMYSNLASLGIGSINTFTNTYTPPNFQGAFLRGIGTSGINGAYVGPITVNSYQDMGIMQHGHTVTDSQHSHIVNNLDTTSKDVTQAVAYNSFNDSFSGDTSVNVPKLNAANTGSSNNSSTGITIGNSSVTTSETYYTTNETRPFNYGVNWIIKI